MIPGLSNRYPIKNARGPSFPAMTKMERLTMKRPSMILYGIRGVVSQRRRKSRNPYRMRVDPPLAILGHDGKCPREVAASITMLQKMGRRLPVCLLVRRQLHCLAQIYLAESMVSVSTLVRYPRHPLLPILRNVSPSPRGSPIFIRKRLLLRKR